MMPRPRTAGFTIIEALVTTAIMGIAALALVEGVTKFSRHQDVETRRMAAMDTSKLITAKVKRRFTDRLVTYAGNSVTQTVSSGYTIGGACKGGACPVIAIDFTDPTNMASTVHMSVTSACRGKVAKGAYTKADFSAVGGACLSCGKGSMPFITWHYSDGRADEVLPYGSGGAPNGGAKIAAGAALCIEALPATGEVRLVASSGYLDTAGVAQQSQDVVLLTTNLPRNMQLIK